MKRVIAVCILFLVCVSAYSDTIVGRQDNFTKIKNSSGTIINPATEDTLTLINNKLVTGTDIGDVTINNASGASAANVQDGGNTITVDALNLDIRDLTAVSDSVAVTTVKPDGTITYMEGEPYWNFSAGISLDTGSLLGTPVPGTFEFYNDRMYLTNVGTQRAIDRTSDVITSTTIVSNTTTETTIFTGTIPADSLKAGNIIKGIVSGVISTATASEDITIRIKCGGTTIQTFTPTLGNLTNADWHIEGNWTVRSVGATGSIAAHTHVDVAGNEDSDNSIETVDTTIAEDITVTIEWAAAKVGNTISIYQGFVEYKN